MYAANPRRLNTQDYRTFPAYCASKAPGEKKARIAASL